MDNEHVESHTHISNTKDLNLKIDIYEIIFNSNIPQNLKHWSKIIISSKNSSLTAK